MRSSFRWVAVATATVAVAVGFSCAGGTGESPGRFAAMEARLARLEALMSPDAEATGPIGDAGALGPLEDASAGASRVRVDAAATRDAAQVPDDAFADCLANAERMCSTQGNWDRIRSQRSPDGGFAWIQTEPVPPADSTSAGRACLRKERASCSRIRKAVEREEQMGAWLDAQLTPDRIDHAFSDAVTARIENEGRLPKGSTEVLCTVEFCRIRSKDGTPNVGRELGHYAVESSGETRGFRDRPGSYVSRKGHRFPQF